MQNDSKNISDEKRKEDIQSAKEFIGNWLIENTGINPPANEAFSIFHWAFDSSPAENLVARMMADYVREKDFIIYGIEEGSDQWKSDAKDWEHKFWQVANALKELVELKHIKEFKGETLEYLERKPKAWETAKLLVDAINKLQNENNT